MNEQLPPLPPGFALDSPSGGMPPLPPGFKLDSGADQPKGWANLNRNTVPHTGYAAQVNAAFNNPNPAPHHEAQSFDELGQSWGRVGKGVAVGIPSGAFGIPGDIEGAGRFVGSKIGLPISRETMLPTTGQIADALGGANPSAEEQLGRAGGSFVSPFVASKALSLAAQLGGKIAAPTLGLTTGSGQRSIEEAFSAGKEGGSAADAFQANLRGKVDPASVVDTAERGVAQLGADRAAAYKAGMGGVRADQTILDFKPINQALRDVADIGTYGGKSLSGATDKVFQKISEVVDDWRQSDPATFHTAEGLDALKRKINNLQYEEDLRPVAAPGTPGAVMVKNVRDAISGVIKEQAPQYAKIMKDYSDASDTLDEIKSTLSINPRASVDTQLRKLQSIMRDNANTNYGQRVNLGQTVDAATGGQLMPQIAGQALKSWTPRGIQGGVTPAAMMGTALTQPMALPAFAAASPRLMGEAAYYAGKAANLGKAIPAVGAATPSIALQIARSLPASSDNGGLNRLRVLQLAQQMGGGNGGP